MFKSIQTCIYTVLLFLTSISEGISSELKTEKIILITLDGVRHQEIFNGLDLSILKATAKGKVTESSSYEEYWANNSIERRKKLMPFFWNFWMNQSGSIAGNQAKGSYVKLTNRLLFSYPGYSEILTGQARDDLIKSNDKIYNPSTTVLEFVKKNLKLNKNQVASFASWDVIPMIVQSQPNIIFTNGGYQAYEEKNNEVQLLNHLQFETLSPWDNVRHDEYTFRLGMYHLKKHEPTLLYLSLGETDDWAHEKRYDRVLDAIARFDSYFKELWRWINANNNYKDKTTIIITTDHGRGDNSLNWHSHNARIKDSRNAWLAIISPDCPLRGEWNDEEPVNMNQIAATISYFLGLDFRTQNPKAGRPIATITKSLKDNK